MCISKDNLFVTQCKHAYQAVALSQQMSHTPSADLILTYRAQGQCPLPMAGTTVQLNHSNVTCHFIKKKNLDIVFKSFTNCLFLRVTY